MKSSNFICTKLTTMGYTQNACDLEKIIIVKLIHSTFHSESKIILIMNFYIEFLKT